ncbi:MAG: hypothetical protein U1D30_05850 [Planctomycetota bacterium]
MLPTGVVRADVVMPGYVAGPVTSGVAPTPSNATVVAAQPAVVQAPSVAVNPAVHAPVTGSSFVPATNYSSSAYQPTPASNVAAAVSQDVAASQPRGYTTPGRYPRREVPPSRETGNEPSSNANFRPNTQGFSDPAGTRKGTANTGNGGQAEELLPPANSGTTDPNARKEKKPASRSGFLDELSPPRG